MKEMKGDLEGGITATSGSIGQLNIKTTGLPNFYTNGSIIFTNQFSIRNFSSGATDLWMTDNTSFNDGTLNVTAPYAGMAIGSLSTGITRGVLEVGTKRQIGSTVSALDYVQVTSAGILMKQRDFITATNNTA
jgi:hypothetical protein